MLQLALAFTDPCRLLHPIMPFVTEELWQKLPKHPSHESRESIMICSYPAAQSAWSNAEVEADMAYVNAIVARTRRLRSGGPASHDCSSWHRVTRPPRADLLWQRLCQRHVAKAAWLYVC